eukprot:765923-Hanusia_phi.AAC.7
MQEFLTKRRHDLKCLLEKEKVPEPAADIVEQYRMQVRYSSKPVNVQSQPLFRQPAVAPFNRADFPHLDLSQVMENGFICRRPLLRVLDAYAAAVLQHSPCKTFMELNPEHTYSELRYMANNPPKRSVSNAGLSENAGGSKFSKLAHGKAVTQSAPVDAVNPKMLIRIAVSKNNNGIYHGTVYQAYKKLTRSLARTDWKG